MLVHIRMRPRRAQYKGAFFGVTVRETLAQQLSRHMLKKAPKDMSRTLQVRARMHTFANVVICMSE